jgi:tetratricopeptide (TPR) repeat protein
MSLHKDIARFNEVVDDYINKWYLNDLDQISKFSEFYKITKKKYNKVKNYYIKEVAEGSRDAMFNLGLYYEKVDDEDNFIKYYKMFIGEIIDSTTKFEEITKRGKREYYCVAQLERTYEGIYYRGGYYYQEEKNYKEMIKFYHLAIGFKNKVAMNNLAVYYHRIEKDYDKAEDYYLMAIEYGSEVALFNLGTFYEKIRNDEDNMKYCFYIYLGGSKIYDKKQYNKIIKNEESIEYYALLFLEKTDLGITHVLGNLYFKEEDYENMMECYLLSIKFGNIYSLFKLAYYYAKVENNEEEMKKYLNIAIENGNEEAKIILANYEMDNIIEKIENKEYKFSNTTRKCVICKKNKKKKMICFKCQEKKIHCYCTDCFVTKYEEDDAFCTECGEILKFSSVD